ncbi:MAG: hypothetical protein ACKVT0_15380 [Planctomycetaceae bacterium]
MKFINLSKRMAWICCIGAVMLSNSGCTLAGGFLQDLYTFSLFWETTPLIPVSAYFSQKVEDAYHEDERYNGVPVLDPIEGENAPIFCMDSPTADEVMRTLPDDTAGGFAFLAETSRNNVRIVVEPLVDKLEECRFYPLVGPARLHKCHYKCTIYFEKVIRSDWPVPFTHSDQTQEVVYIDHDHLIRCAGPATPQ